MVEKIGKALIAPVGERIDNIYFVLKEMSVRKIHLVTSQDNFLLAQKVRAKIEKQGYPTTLWPMHGDVWEETFRIMSEIAQTEKDAVIHVGTGDRAVQCAATSAAFVNGVHAIDGDDTMLMALPVLRFNYYTELTPKKLDILAALDAKRYTSIDALGAAVTMPLPLLSYHLHGNHRTEGLAAMGLITIGKRGTKEAILITPMARLLLKGYVRQTSAETKRINKKVKAKRAR